jgi:hypothetical protein
VLRAYLGPVEREEGAFFVMDYCMYCTVTYCNRKENEENEDDAAPKFPMSHELGRLVPFFILH